MRSRAGRRGCYIPAPRSIHAIHAHLGVPMDALTAYLEQHRDRFVEDLKAALRIPSVSAKAEHKQDCARCAAFIADHLKSLGMTRVEVAPTAGHPVVYAEWLGA